MVRFAIAVLAFSLGAAQINAADLAFEVATVKTSPPPPQIDRININLGTYRNGLLTFTNASLSDCLKFAYGLVSDEQLSGPSWIKSKSVRFDVVAKTAPDTPIEQVREMLQSLLAERLKVTIHHEQRDLLYLALVRGKNGAKLRAAPQGATQSNGLSVQGHISGSAMPISMLALLLSRFGRQTVIDKTGLAGFFQINLEWTPDELLPAPGGTVRPPEPDLDTHPPLAIAVQEQLGLKLETRTGPLDVIVVDHAEETPIEN